MSALVLGALRALGGRPSLEEIEQVASALRKSGDPKVLTLFRLGAPVTDEEAWKRFIALVEERDVARQFTALISFRTSRRRAVSVGFVNAAGSPRPRKSPVLEVRPVTYGSWRYCRAVGPSCRRRGAPDATRYRPAPPQARRRPLRTAHFSVPLRRFYGTNVTFTDCERFVLLVSTRWAKSSIADPRAPSSGPYRR
jgi:hypothetical protein